MKFNSWPILSFIPPSLSKTLKKTFVFGGAGNEALIILKNGDVYALGFNGNGCLGVGNSSSTLEPKKIEELCQKNIVDLTYGMGPHVLAVTEDGSLYSWGHGGYGQLGHNDSDKNRPVKVSIPKKVIQVACGSYHSIALTEDGEVYAWGSNNCGQLGLGVSNNQPTPRRVTGHLSTCNKKVTGIASGQSFTIALTEDGVLCSWGYNGNGQLGIGNNTNQQLPARVMNFVGKFVEKIACGMAHVLVLTDTGELYSWGANSYGQLGHGTTLNTSVPTQITTVEERWVDIAAHHYNHISAGITISGKICMWGQCHGLTLLSPREVSVSSLDGVFACFGMSQIMFRLCEIEKDESDSLKEVVSKSFNNEETSDLKIIIDNKSIYVHKSILKIRCLYFRNMLQTHWEESGKDEIEINQFTYEVYHSFLKYLYTDVVDVKNGDALDNLSARSVEKSMTTGVTSSKQTKSKASATALKTDNEFLRSSKTFLVNALEKIKKDPINNITVDKFVTSGNEVARLADEILEAFSKNSNICIQVTNEIVSLISNVIRKTNFSLPGQKEKMWSDILTIVKFQYKNNSLYSFSKKQINNLKDITFSSMYYSVCVSILYFTLKHFNDRSVTVEKNVNTTLSQEERQILHYVSGYLLYSMLKKYKGKLRNQKQSEILIATVQFFESLISSPDDLFGNSFSEYIKKWTKLISRGYLIEVSYDMFQFVECIEQEARKILNIAFIKNHIGTDIRDTVENLIETSNKVSSSWSSLIRDCPNEQLTMALKKEIIRKWVDIRANSFVQAYVLILKKNAKASKEKSKLSKSSEPALRKTLSKS